MIAQDGTFNSSCLLQLPAEILYGTWSWECLIPRSKNLLDQVTYGQGGSSWAGAFHFTGINMASGAHPCCERGQFSQRREERWSMGWADALPMVSPCVDYLGQNSFGLMLVLSFHKGCFFNLFFYYYFFGTKGVFELPPWHLYSNPESQGPKSGRNCHTAPWTCHYQWF